MRTQDKICTGERAGRDALESLELKRSRPALLLSPGLELRATW